MPIDPINYMVNVPDPLQSVLGGFQAGTAIRRQPLLEQREATEFGQQQLLFSQAQEDRQRALAEVERQRARAMQTQADLDALASDPAATAADYNRFALEHPEVAEEVRKGWDVMDAANKESSFLNYGQTYAALSSGNFSMAEQMMADRSEALRNSGREDEAATADAFLELMKASPEAAQVSIGIAMAAINPDDFSTMFSTLEEQRRARVEEPWTESEQATEIKQAVADLNLTEAQTNKILVETKDLSADAARAVIKFEERNQADAVSTEDIFNFEDKLRKQYVARIGTFPEARVQYDKLLASANVPNAETGAGDVALVFSFMKMLDPGSVVRESEFALAQNTGGLLTRLQNTLTKAEKGEFMTPTQRKEMLALAGKYMEAAQSEADRVRADLMIPVTNYNLTPENVFGVAALPGEPTAPTEQPTPTPPQAPDALSGAQSLMQQFGGGS